jgi:RNA polymerase primary sigma factor
MNLQNNEQLCTLAQKGDRIARDLLLVNNLKFIRKIVNEIYHSMNLPESDLGIEKEDLEQEGCIGLLNAIPHFNRGREIKFLTYAAPSIKNAMTNLIRKALAQYEQRMTDIKDGLAYQKIRLDEVIPGDERMLRIEAIADPTVKSPEQIYVEQETLRELYAALGRISDREQTYLLYRYGFTDDMEHTMIGTAIHFNLRESRAKKLENQAMDNLWLELPWWF